MKGERSKGGSGGLDQIKLKLKGWSVRISNGGEEEEKCKR